MFIEDQASFELISKVRFCGFFFFLTLRPDVNNTKQVLSTNELYPKSSVIKLS